MKKISPTKVLALAVLAGSMSYASLANAANKRGFHSTLSAPATSVKINVTLSDDLIYRADNVSPRISDRRGSRSLKNGFTSRGIYGERDLNQLVDRLERKMDTYLEKYGVEVSEDATTVLNLVITDVDNNRPTFAQLSNSPSLSFRSFGNGGADLDGTLTRDGQDLGSVSYSWHENDIRNAGFGGTWQDANRAIDRFARRTAKALAAN